MRRRHRVDRRQGRRGRRRARPPPPRRRPNGRRSRAGSRRAGAPFSCARRPRRARRRQRRAGRDRRWKAVASADAPQQAPGMLRTHYAPDGPPSSSPSTTARRGGGRGGERARRGGRGSRAPSSSTTAAAPRRARSARVPRPLGRRRRCRAPPPSSSSARLGRARQADGGARVILLPDLGDDDDEQVPALARRLSRAASGRECAASAPTARSGRPPTPCSRARGRLELVARRHTALVVGVAPPLVVDRSSAVDPVQRRLEAALARVRATTRGGGGGGACARRSTRETRHLEAAANPRRPRAALAACPRAPRRARASAARLHAARAVPRVGWDRAERRREAALVVRAAARPVVRDGLADHDVVAARRLGVPHAWHTASSDDDDACDADAPARRRASRATAPRRRRRGRRRSPGAPALRSSRVRPPTIWTTVAARGSGRSLRAVAVVVVAELDAACDRGCGRPVVVESSVDVPQRVASEASPARPLERPALAEPAALQPAPAQRATALPVASWAARPRTELLRMARVVDGQSCGRGGFGEPAQLASSRSRSLAKSSSRCGESRRCRSARRRAWQSRRQSLEDEGSQGRHHGLRWLADDRRRRRQRRRSSRSMLVRAAIAATLAPRRLGTCPAWRRSRDVRSPRVSSPIT